MTNKKFNWTKTILKLLISGFLLGIFLLLVYLLLHYLGYSDLSREALQEIIKKTGVYGKLIFIFITFLQVTFIPLPGAITILAGNYLFGFWLGFILSFIGMMIGSMVAFLLGRSIGRKFVYWAIGDKALVDFYLNKLKSKEIVLLFFMFLLPLFPDDALCLIAGITKIKTFVFTLIQLITRPISILGTLLFMSGEIIPYEGFGLLFIILIGITSIILFIFSYKYSERINSFLENLASKILHKFKWKKKNNIIIL